jgi:hypothetical protein
MKTSKKGKSVTFEVSAWWSPDDKSIHLASNASDSLIVTVNDDPSKKRGHPKLFRDWLRFSERRVLRLPNEVLA